MAERRGPPAPALWQCPADFPTPGGASPDAFVLRIPGPAPAGAGPARKAALQQQVLKFVRVEKYNSWRLATVRSIVPGGAAEWFSRRFSLLPPQDEPEPEEIFEGNVQIDVGSDAVDLAHLYTKTTSDGTPIPGPRVSGGNIVKALTICAREKKFKVTVTDEADLTRVLVWKEGRSFYAKYGFVEDPEQCQAPENPPCGPSSEIPAKVFWAWVFCPIGNRQYSTYDGGLDKPTNLQREVQRVYDEKYSQFVSQGLLAHNAADMASRKSAWLCGGELPDSIGEDVLSEVRYLEGQVSIVKIFEDFVSRARWHRGIDRVEELMKDKRLFYFFHTKAAPIAAPCHYPGASCHGAMVFDGRSAAAFGLTIPT